MEPEVTGELLTRSAKTNFPAGFSAESLQKLPIKFSNVPRGNLSAQERSSLTQLAWCECCAPQAGHGTAAQLDQPRRRLSDRFFEDLNPRFMEFQFDIIVTLNRALRAATFNPCAKIVDFSA